MIMKNFRLSLIVIGFTLSNASLSFGMQEKIKQEQEKRNIKKNIIFLINNKHKLEIPFGSMYSISGLVRDMFEEYEPEEITQEELTEGVISIEFDETLDPTLFSYYFKVLILQLNDEKDVIDSIKQLYSNPYLYCALIQFADFLQVDQLLKPLVTELPGVFIKDPKLLLSEEMEKWLSKIQGPIKEILGSLYYPSMTLAGHANKVTSVIWSPDGKQIASGLWDDKTVRIWDAATGKLLKTLTGHTSMVTSVAWSPDGKQIVSGSEDDTVRIWDAATGKLFKTLTGHTRSVTSVAWSPKGEKIVSGSWDKTVRIWDAATGKLLKTLIGHTSMVTSVAWSPSGELIAFGSWDKTVKIWDAATAKLFKTLTGHTSMVTSVAWNPSGKLIASGSNDKTVKIWDVATDELLQTLTGHTSTVTSVAWNPSGKLIVSGSNDKTVKIWDVATDELLQTLTGHTEDVTSVAWSPDRKQIASGSDDKTVKIWAPIANSVANYDAILLFFIAKAFHEKGKKMDFGSWSKIAFLALPDSFKKILTDWDVISATK
jgi:hypothetical protein